MSKRKDLKSLLIVVVVVSLLLNVFFVTTKLTKDYKQKVYSSAYNDIITTMYQKAKEGGNVKIVVDGETVLLTPTYENEAE